MHIGSINIQAQHLQVSLPFKSPGNIVNHPNTLNEFPRGVNSNSQHTSQDMVQQQQERMMDENELNDDHCFKCGKKGELYCCDLCFRAFHKHCITTKRFTKVWSCEYCSTHDLCLTCYQPFLLNDLTYTCTLCFRSLHRTCSPLPYTLLSSHNHFFPNASNFTCEPCIKQFGFKIVLTYQRILVQDAEKLFYFVMVNTRSPIHCGWFQESTLREVPRCKDAEQLRETEVYQVPIIQRIVRMRTPSELKHEDREEILNQLIVNGLPISTYGSMNNYYFLVVWEGRDLAAATWEDQNVIRIHNNNNSQCRQFIKYLLYRKLEIAVREKKNFNGIYALFDKYLPNPNSNPGSIQALSNHLYTHSIPNSTHYCLSPNTSDAISFVNSYLVSIYPHNLLYQPTLLICSNSSIGKWQRRVRENCIQLMISVLKGSEANIYQIKQKQLMYQTQQQTKFHILIIPFERWGKERKHFTSKYCKFSTLILDAIHLDSSIEEELQKIPNNCDRRIILIDSHTILQKILSNTRSKKVINLTQQCSQTFIYDLSTPKILNGQMRQITQYKNTKQQLQLLARGEELFQWDQLKRTIFLRFILAYGFNCDPNFLFQKINKFAPGIFLNQQEKIYGYSHRFMAALYDYKNLLTHLSYRQFYFLDIPVSYTPIKPTAIYKRICKLGKLRKQVQKYRSNCKLFPFSKPMKVFMETTVSQITLWRSHHDYLLAALIVQKGFGRWTEISQCKTWQKWSSPCHYPLIMNSYSKKGFGVFGEMVKEVVLLSNCRKVNIIRVEEILKERGIYLLKQAQE